MKYKIEDINYLITVALSAGKEIMRIYDDKYTIEFKDDQSPLTIADLLSDQIILNALRDKYPDVYYFSEETNQEKIKEFTTFFLVDPLDGTKEFIKKNGEFTVNIALIVDSILEIGVVYAPALNELFYGSRQFGAYKVITENHLLTDNLIQLNHMNDYSGPLRIVASRSHTSTELNTWLSDLKQPYELRNYGSSLKFCRVAECSADIYPRFGLTSQWDTAAGQCILECAGGEVVDQHNKALQYSLNRPILNPNFIAYRVPKYNHENEL
jgi:3'(2'),5'-bisphosphate nucleotidase